MLYVLLALSVVVSVFGMINTLVLAVHERTRELGMLRAVGMTRRQARRMVRGESVVTALIGAAIGLPLGIGMAALATRAMSEWGVALSLPVVPLTAFVLVAVAVGVIAAVAPARRAARLDVLRALQYESPSGPPPYGPEAAVTRRRFSRGARGPAPDYGGGMRGIATGCSRRARWRPPWWRRHRPRRPRGGS